MRITGHPHMSWVNINCSSIIYFFVLIIKASLHAQSGLPQGQPTGIEQHYPSRSNIKTLNPEQTSKETKRGRGNRQEIKTLNPEQTSKETMRGRGNRQESLLLVVLICTHYANPPNYSVRPREVNCKANIAELERHGTSKTCPPITRFWDLYGNHETIFLRKHCWLGTETINFSLQDYGLYGKWEPPEWNVKSEWTTQMQP